MQSVLHYYKEKKNENLAYCIQCHDAGRGKGGDVPVCCEDPRTRATHTHTTDDVIPSIHVVDGRTTTRMPMVQKKQAQHQVVRHTSTTTKTHTRQKTHEVVPSTQGRLN